MLTITHMRWYFTYTHILHCVSMSIVTGMNIPLVMLIYCMHRDSDEKVEGHQVTQDLTMDHNVWSLL